MYHPHEMQTSTAGNCLDPLRDPKTVLVAQLAFIGDMVFATPLFDAIAERWPGARLVVVGRPAAVKLLSAHPAVGMTLEYDKHGVHRGLTGLWSLGRAIRGLTPDLFIGLSRSQRTSILARISGAAVRVGFGSGRLAYTHRVRQAHREIPFAERGSALLRAIGVEVPSRPLHLEIDIAARANGRARLEALGWRGRPLIAVSPGAHYATKRWPPSHVSDFLDRVAAHDRWDVALYGGPEEDDLIDRLVQAHPWVLDRRSLPFAETMEEFCSASLHLGGDSGPTHIARALGVPAVLLLGPTPQHPLGEDSGRTIVSLNLECQPCSGSGDAKCPLDHHACMERLSAELVFRAVSELLPR